LTLIHRHLNIAFQLSFFICGLYTVFVMIFPTEIMTLLYNTTTGSEFLLIMAPFFLLLHFQSILTATLQSIDEAKLTMNASLISSIIKISLLVFLLQVPQLNIKGLVISVLAHIFILTAWNYRLVQKKTHYRANYGSIINGILILGITYLFGYYLNSTVIFVSHSMLNVLILMGIITFAYISLTALCGLFPKQLLGGKRSKETSCLL